MFWCPGPTGVGFGVPFFVSGLYKFMGKLADRIFFGVHGPRGLGLGCRSLCLRIQGRNRMQSCATSRCQKGV